MSAAGLPVCLTRPPKLVLHPPPVSKSDIKPVPGLGHCCRKTTKKQARKGGLCVIKCSSSICKWALCKPHLHVPAGKTPEEVVKRYLQKVRNPPEEVSSSFSQLITQSQNQAWWGAALKTSLWKLLYFYIYINTYFMHM